MTRVLRVVALVVLGAFSAAPAAQQWQSLTADEHGLPGNEIQFLRERDDGSVWIGTLTGLGLWRAGRCETVVAGARVWDVLETGPGCYWVGTGKGAVRVTPDGTQTTAEAFTVSPLTPRQEDVVWAIFKQKEGVFRLHQNAGTGWEPVPAFSDEAVLDMLRARDGTIWLSVEGNGVFAIPPGTDPAEAKRHLEGRHVSAMAEDSQGRLWCGTWGTGLFVFEKHAWARHLQKEKSSIIAIAEDARGLLWAGSSNNGLWKQTADGWMNDLSDEGGINMLAATPDGRVWISTQTRGGLRYWDGQTWIVSLDTPFPIRCLVQRRNGELWAGGVLDGVHVLKKPSAPPRPARPGEGE